jgi:hypothetical protein
LVVLDGELIRRTNQGDSVMMIESFQTISSDLLVTATGGAGQAPQQKPAQPQRGISTGDVVEVAGKATEAVLSRGASLIPNVGQAYRQFNDPRVGTGFMDRMAYGFTGLFGIDPLANQ